MKEFSDGELTKKTGVKVETLRFYEKKDVMPKP